MHHEYKYGTSSQISEFYAKFLRADFKPLSHDYNYILLNMRELKFHEQKLLKKVDFLKWNKKDASLREIAVLRRYHVQNREDY